MKMLTETVVNTMICLRWYSYTVQ